MSISVIRTLILFLLPIVICCISLCCFINALFTIMLSCLLGTVIGEAANSKQCFSFGGRTYIFCPSLYVTFWFWILRFGFALCLYSVNVKCRTVKTWQRGSGFCLMVQSQCFPWAMLLLLYSVVIMYIIYNPQRPESEVQAFTGGKGQTSWREAIAACGYLDKDLFVSLIICKNL